MFVPVICHLFVIAVMEYDIVAGVSGDFVMCLQVLGM